MKDQYNNQTAKTVIIDDAELEIKIDPDYIATAPTFPCGDDGKVAVTSVSGGVAPYEYNRTEDNLSYSSTPVIPAYSSGFQRLFVRDSLGCVFGFAVEIPPGPDALSVQIDTITQVTCFDGDDGRCILIADHAVDTLFVKESSMPESQITISNDTVFIEGLNAGPYSILLADATCESFLSFTVPGKNPISLTPFVTPVSDKGTATGSIRLEIDGGNGKYTAELTETGDQIAAPPYLFVSLAGDAADGGKPYLFEITDSPGCSYHAQTGDYYTVRVPEPVEKLHLSASVTQSVSCHGGSNAIVTLTSKDGWSDHQYSRDKTAWTPNDRFFDLPAGEHQFFVKDLYGGTDSVTVAVSQPAPLSVAVDSVQNVLCHGENSGWIRYRVSGGTFPYSFAPNRLYDISFNGTDTLLTAQGLIAENYTLTVKDGNGCEIAAPAQTVTQPDTLQITVKSVTHTTCERANGRLTAWASGGVAPYVHTIEATDYTWVDTQQLSAMDSIRFDSIPAGSYRIFTTDQRHCSVTSALQTVNGYVNPWIDTLTVDDVTCFGENSGKIKVDAGNGTSPVDYITLLSVDSVFTQTSMAGVFEDLFPNMYFVNVFDSTGCKSSQTYFIVLSEPEELTVRVDSVHHVAGKGTSTGYISFRIEGGNSGTKQIRLTNADGVEIARKQERSGAPLVFPGLSAGKYVIEAVDRKGCAVLSDSLSVEEPATALGLMVTAKKDALCKSQTGSITVEGFGGWGDYHYKRLANSAFFRQNTFTQLYAGTYVITVTDKMGATCSETVTIYEPRDSLSVTLLDLLPPSCGDNGSLTVKVNGGTAPYRLAEDSDTLHIALPQTVYLPGKAAGAHILRLLDVNGCHFDLEAPMPDTALLQIASFETAYPSSPGASDGSVRAIVQGGRQPLTWQWKERFGAPLSAAGAALENIPSGHYQANVTDGSGCAVTGYAYLPDHTDATFEIIGVGHETSFGAGNGYAILYPENDILTEYKLISPSGEMFTYDELSSDDRFHVSEDTIYLEKLEGGAWFLSGKSTIGRNVIAEFRIEPYKPFIWLTPEIVHARIYGAANGRVTVETAGGGGGNRFEWSSESGNIPSIDDAETSTIQNIPAGTYSVTVTDRYGNSISENFTVMEPEKPLKLSVYEKRDESCKTYQDAYVILQAEGGWGEYHFRHDAETYPGALSNYPNLEVRSHYFYLLDRMGISDSILVDITEPEYLHASVAQVDSVLCFDVANGRVLFDITGGTAPYRFENQSLPGLWMDGALATGLHEGNYTFRFTDSHSCVGQDTLTVYVPEPDELLVRDVQITHTTCNEDNGRMEVTMQGGTVPYTYRWTDGADQTRGDNRIITGMKQNGQYHLRVTDRNHCEQRLTQLIRPSTKTVVDNVAITPVICYGETNGTARVTSVTPASPFAPYSLAWSNGDTGDYTNRYAYGTHHITVTDTNQCVTVKYFDIQQPDSLRSELLDSREPHCYGWNDAFLKTKALGGVEPYLYRWSTGDTVPAIENLTKGEYLLLLSDANNCRSPQVFAINEPDELHVDIGEGITMCPGNSYTIDGHNYPSYRWFTADGNISDERYLTVHNEGDYFLEATDIRGCAVWGKFSLAIGNNVLTSDFLLSSAAAEGDTLMLIELSNLPTDSLRWEYDDKVFELLNRPDDNQAYLLQLLCRQTGMYNIGMYAYSGGCTSYAVKQVEVMPAGEAPEKPDVLGYKDPLITSFIAYPNPNNGMFDVAIELREKADIRLTLFEVASGMRLKDLQDYNADKYLENFSMSNLNSGVYVLVLTAGNERRQVKIVVAR
ncbi:MAG: T9SS type A sorting domain-containing protein [Bacteroidales bacterium]|nr:T9SS type A sorting domain-containing protein [Bacteroidales bacterium]